MAEVKVSLKTEHRSSSGGGLGWTVCLVEVEAGGVVLRGPEYSTYRDEEKAERDLERVKSALGVEASDEPKSFDRIADALTDSKEDADALHAEYEQRRNAGVPEVPHG